MRSLSHNALEQGGICGKGYKRQPFLVGNQRYQSLQLPSYERYSLGKASEKKRGQIAAKLVKAAGRIKQMDFTQPARTGLKTKFKFYAVRMMHIGRSEASCDDSGLMGLS